jgi:hypothetical protein
MSAGGAAHDPCGIGAPTLQGEGRVDGDGVALADDPRAGGRVGDLLVEGDRGGAGEAGVAHDGAGAGLRDPCGDQRIQVACARAGLRGVGRFVEDAGKESARAAHGVDVARGFERDGHFVA